MTKASQQGFLLICLLLASADALNVPIVVTENQGVSVTDYPIDVVVPLPEGNSYTIENLSIEGLPSQVKALERWPSDQSLRNVLVHFQASGSANSNVGYSLVDQAPPSPPTPIIVSDSDTTIMVDTGKIRFTVKKSSFNLIDELWVDRNGDGDYQASEKTVLSSTLNGGHMVPREGAGSTQYDSSRTDVSFRVEETGPLRVVIRAEAYTMFESTTDHQHGFAVRIYAYANQPYVKVDYQLQNSAKNVKKSWPLYLEAMNLDLSVAMSNPSIVFGSTNGQTTTTVGSAHMAQERHDEYVVYNQDGTELKREAGMDYENDYRDGTGFMSLTEGNMAVSVIGRNFWQMWPNGLRFEDSKMSVELFPSWSAQWEQGDGAGKAGRVSPTGLYWIKDMQHVYKETMFVFHTSPPTAEKEIQDLASTFQFQPVGSVAFEWHRSSKAGFDLGGYIPSQIAPITPCSGCRAVYESFYTYKLDPDSKGYTATVRAWGDPEVGYRNAAYTAGGWPYSSEHFLVTGDSGDYFVGELMAIGELNVRPQSLAGYDYERNQELLELTSNPYPPNLWRAFDGHGVSLYAMDLLPDTINVQPEMVSRDDAHGWFYHVAHSYFYTGNPWVKDWYEFVVEFRKVRLSQGDPFPPMQDRELGHSLHHAYQAARVAGDPEFGSNFAFYLRNYLRPAQDLVYGQQIDDRASFGGGFQTGYFMRAMIAYMEQARGVDAQGYAEAFQYLSGQMAWNLHYGNFPYYHNAATTGGAPGSKSSGTGLTLVDPQSWYYWHTGLSPFWEQIEQFMDGGINGGRGPFGKGFGTWNGHFEGRMYNFVLESVRSDTIPPSAIADLVVGKSGSTVQLEWTTPQDALRFHVVWSDRSISATQTTSTLVRNWWAAETVGTSLVGVPGSKQTLSFSVGSSTGSVYVAIFSFDSNDNMSEMSNSVQATSGPVNPVLPPTVTPTMAPTLPPTNAPVQMPSGSLGICFSGNNEVEVLSKGRVKMQHLQLGDMVRVRDNRYERVYSFGHRDESGSSGFMQIVTDGEREPLEISSHHMVLVDGRHHIPVAMVKIGDLLTSTTGSTVEVVAINRVTRKGVFAPFTASGTIVVNDLVASTYVAYQFSEYLRVADIETPFSYQWLAHTFNAGHRIANRIGFTGETYTEDGISDWVAFPHNVATWFFEQHCIVTVGLLLLFVAYLSIMSVVEALVMNPVATGVLVAGVILYLTSNQYIVRARKKRN